MGVGGAGGEVLGLCAPRFMATACRITNTGNLKSPPVTSFLLLHSSSPLSNTITLLSGLSLFSSLLLFFLPHPLSRDCVFALADSRRWQIFRD